MATDILIEKYRLLEGEPSQAIEVNKLDGLEDVRGGV